MAKKGKKKYKAPIQKTTSQPIKAKVAAATRSASRVSESTFIFGRTNYIYMLAGAACLAIGLLLMSGGGMPDPDTWDNSIIYSHRRITLAPMVMIVGLILLVMSIFKR